MTRTMGVSVIDNAFYRDQHQLLGKSAHICTKTGKEKVLVDERSTSTFS